MADDRESPLVIGRPVQTMPHIKGMGPGDRENSLYQQTLKLLAELRTIAELDKWIFPCGIDEGSRDQAFVDPVATLWACFRLGKPLCILYNALKPNNPIPLQPISIPPNATSYPNSCKKAVYDFIVACKRELGMEESDLFTISGLYKDDTNEFVKLLNTLTIIVGKMREEGLISEPEPLPFPGNEADSAPKDHTQKLLDEILSTERSYISDLEYLQRYKIALQGKNQIPKSALTAIFSNLDNLLDFQRRFLLQMEAALAMGSSFPKLGPLFVQNETQFSVYVIFCSNYQSATRQIAKLESAVDPIDPNIDPVRGLQSYLIRPIQRLCKYPLFLQELIKYSDKDNPCVAELMAGLDSIKRVITLVNEEKRREENFLIKKNFIERMKDWRGINVREFGDLLLCDTFVTNSMDVERPWQFFLFETILLCVKDTGRKKKSRKSSKKDSQIFSGMELYSPVPTVYVLKGQILVSKMIYVTDTPDKSSSSYILKIFWTEGQTTNYVSLKCRNSEQSRQWKNKISYLIKRNRSKSASVETANQRYNEPGRSYGGSMESKRANKHHSGSDIYMLNDADGSIDSLPDEMVSRSSLNGSSAMQSDFRNTHHAGVSAPYKIFDDPERALPRDGGASNPRGKNLDPLGKKTALNLQMPLEPLTCDVPRRYVAQHAQAYPGATDIPPILSGPNTESAGARQRARAMSVSTNPTPALSGPGVHHNDPYADIAPRKSSFSRSGLPEHGRPAPRKNTYPPKSFRAYPGEKSSDDLSPSGSDPNYAAPRRRPSSTKAKDDVTSGSFDLSPDYNRSSNLSASAGMIIGTYDSRERSRSAASSHSQSSSNYEDSDSLDDLEPFVNSQKFDPASYNFDRVGAPLNSAADRDSSHKMGGDPVRKKSSIARAAEVISHISIDKGNTNSSSNRESSKLASMSSKLDGIAMSFAHVAEEELEKSASADYSPVTTQPVACVGRPAKDLDSKSTSTSSKRSTIHLKVNYHLNSYIIALVPPVSYDMLYEKVRSKVYLAKGVPLASHANLSPDRGSADKSYPPLAPGEKPEKIRIAYALDNGATNYVESDKEAREAADPGRRHFSDGIFVS